MLDLLSCLIFQSPTTLSHESTNRGLVCAHMHSIAQTQKILTFMSLAGECQQPKHTQHAPFMKTECDYLNGWNKNGHIRKNLTQKGEPQIYSWGTQKKKKTKKKKKKDNCSSAMLINSCLSPGQSTWTVDQPVPPLTQYHQVPGRAVCLLVGCLTSQQHASVSQGRICTDNFTCCHTEIEAADQTFYLTQSQYTDNGLTSPSADPITPGAWQGSHWSANF